MKLFRLISCLALCLLVLVSSSSFMVGIHVCGGKVQNVALLSKAEACAMEQAQPPCHRHMTAPCCEDKQIVHEGQGFKHSLASIALHAPNAIDIEVPVVLIAEIIPSSLAALAPARDYRPPQRVHDRTTSLQVFRI